MTTVRLGISTCPNDTFAFHGLLTGAVDRRGVDYAIELLDVQELNEGLAAGAFDAAKASFHAAIRMSDRYGVFRSGSALGFGVGPLLLAAGPTGEPRDAWHDLGGNHRPFRVLCPGEATTAHLLYRLFYGRGEIAQVVFSDIMPALRDGTADYGVCIHEGRFTWAQQGLTRIADLGELWEAKTGVPLPLGGILGRTDLPAELLQRIGRTIGDSVRYGLEHRDETLSTMRRYAQEFDDEVLMSHVDLYVNDWTVDLGPVGAAALAKLDALSRAAGLIPSDRPPLKILTD